MRPIVPDFSSSPSPSPPRKLSTTDLPAPSWPDPSRVSGVPTSFFLARDVNDDQISPRETTYGKESTYGVQSLEDTISAVDASSGKEDTSSHDAMVDSADPTSRRRTTLKPSDLLAHIDRLDTPLSKALSRTSPVPSRPLTPFNMNDDPLSIPSSPKSISSRSFRPLDDISITDEINSQAIVSGGEEEEEEEDEAPETSPSAHHHGVSDSSSQLIMPSIRMPSRRPFTERGKNIGRFKILVAGSKGCGKSSLIKSIVQTCDDIVHVDPGKTSSPSEFGRRYGKSTPQKSNTAVISEIHASTKPYPSWWADIEESRILRRRKSNNGVVLERNLCFVDVCTSNQGKPDEAVQLIIQYMKQQLSGDIGTISHLGTDLQNILGGKGGCQVDLILYLVSEETLALDVECMRQLSDYSNVIPLVSKADLLSQSQITDFKSAFYSLVAQRGVNLFPLDGSDGISGSRSQPLFTVSSAHTNDEDNMDASMLMSPDYVPPLVASEIIHLIDWVFDSDNMSRLRHTAAKKLIRHGTTWMARPSDMALNKRPRSRSPGGALAPCTKPLNNGAKGPLDHPGTALNYTLARVNDYTQNEERLAQVRLAKWAADLQQSLENERERYAALARGERAAWLTERLGECVIDGTLVPVKHAHGSVGSGKHPGAIVVRTSNGQTVEYRLTKLSPEDPLGLVQWNDDLRRRGLIIMQVVGSFGVVGGLALWLAKFWGFSSQSLSDWHFFHWIDSQE